VADVILDVDHFLWSFSPFTPSQVYESTKGTIYVFRPEHANPTKITAGNSPVFSAKTKILDAGDITIARLIKHAYKGRSRWYLVSLSEFNDMEEWGK